MKILNSIGRPEPARSAPVPTTAPQAEAGFLAKWNTFWFTPTDPWRLHLFRMMIGGLIFTWLALFFGNYETLFSLEGMFDAQAFVEVQDQRTFPMGPPAQLNWSPVFLTRNNPQLFQYFCIGALAVTFLFTLGIAVRLTGILTWLVTVSFLINPVIAFDGDYLLVLLAFYMALGYAFLWQWSRPLPIVSRILGPFDAWLLGKNPTPTVSGNIAMRLLQINFLIIIVTSLLHKTQNPMWWSGVAFWFPLHEPFETTKEAYLQLRSYGRAYLIAISLGQYLMVAWQIALPFFAYRQGRLWRTLLVGGGILGWIGSVFIFGQPLFGPVYLIGCLSFVTAEEWRVVRARFAR